MPKKKYRTIIKRLFIFLIKLSLLTLFFLGLAVFFQGWRHSVWNGHNNFNFVIWQDKTLIYSYHPDDASLKIISLPNELSLAAAKGYGDYKLQNIPALGEQEKIGAGKLLSLSLQNFFLAPIDGYVIQLKSQKSKVKTEELEKGKLYFLASCFVNKNCQSNLSWWDLIRISLAINRLKLNQIIYLDIQEAGLVKKAVLADKSEVFILEDFGVDEFSQKIFLDRALGEQDYKVSVVNATNFPGLAKNMSRFLTNIGVHVILSEDADQNQELTYLYFQDEKAGKSAFVARLGQIFGMPKKERRLDIKGDVAIVLGNDFVRCFYKR